MSRSGHMRAYPVYSPIVERIIKDIPELMKRGKYWEILDHQENIYLLSTPRRAKVIHNVWKTFDSSISAVEFDGRKFNLRYLETYDAETEYGILCSKTGHAVLVRYNEYDDSVEERHGFDDIYIISYKENTSISVQRYLFGIGKYHGGQIGLALNEGKHWIAFCRNEYDGWEDLPTTSVYIFDLADMELLVACEIESIDRINSIELPGSGEFLVITDGNRRDHLFAIDGSSLSKVTPETRETGKAVPQRKWQIAISFAGEDRHIAEALAVKLKNRGIAVFYDSFESSNLWGKDLYQFLYDVYARQTEYCLVLVSENYKKKAWTKHELKAIQARAFNSDEYILPLRIDNTELPALPPTIGYLTYQPDSLKTIIDAIESKLKK